ncbi:hypothetical protein EOI86_22460 [Hwanghaeella grinnelliae]|uniref:AMP-dependent synthetase/ligase domain-containing protein n=1 Tax=Hwanghaeella grinnelliae TaxID=2500179 RepID=A0A3S2VKC4_9PROT|nr:AMP-binding protein [Hwanghaeella grinnelliae]RVU33897.1 hypothetical protein EOI86_22460 [Hwanghaeella grinnelliae]
MHKVFTALAHHAAADPTRPAFLKTDGSTLTYGQLSGAIADFSEKLPLDARTVALRGIPSFAWIVADLAISLTGKRVVPVPMFFSKEQIGFILQDAGCDLIVDCDIPEDAQRQGGGIPIISLRDEQLVRNKTARDLPPYQGGAERVIYTSGTTGRPKGVRHGDRQLDFAVSAIGEAVNATADDRHLSLLPPALLLEQIAGFFLPITVGAQSILAPGAGIAALTGEIAPMAKALSSMNPTTTVLVPQLVSALVRFSDATGWCPPPSLRIAAVGGAPIAPNVLDAADAIGLPVRYGYGLSECCSVVSVDTAANSNRDAGPVPPTGRPLPGIDIRIEDDEIVIRSPGVMIGYLNHPELGIQEWRTGDLGRIEPDGRITVLGRKDRRLILSNGRNVSPEWIESHAMGLPWIEAAKATGHGETHVTLHLTVRAPDDRWLDATPDSEFAGQLNALFATLPDYARPVRAEISLSRNPDRIRTIPLDVHQPTSNVA